MRDMTEIDDTIKKLLDEGKTDDEIGEALGKTRDYVRTRRWMLRLPQPNRRPRKRSIDYDAIVRLFDERQMNASQIADELGLKVKAVARVLQISGRKTNRGRRKATPKKRARRQS